VRAGLSTTIDEAHLSAQKRSVSYTCNEVARRCRNAGLPLPHASTVHRRIKALSAKETLHRREGGKTVRNKYAPIQVEDSRVVIQHVVPTGRFDCKRNSSCKKPQFRTAGDLAS